MKVLIITIGISILCLALLTWGYLMFFGTPDSTKEVFMDLTNNTEPSVQRPVVSDDPVVTTFQDASTNTPERAQSQNVYQLSTRTVAGFIYLHNQTTPVVRIAERGTGHIYDIPTVSGSEVRVSGTTITGTVEATFSPDGTQVVYTTEEGDSQNALLGTIADNKTTDLSPLQGHTDNLHFTSSTSVQYTASDPASGTKGYVYNTVSQEQSLLFDIPLSAVDVLWTDTATYIVNKPGATLLGSVYTLVDNDLERFYGPGYSLNAFANPSGETLITTHSELDTNQVISEITSNAATTPSPITTFAEKCVFDAHTTNTAWCATPLGVNDTSFLNNWYKGIVIAQDYLWKIDLNTNEASLEIDFIGDTGRTVDVTNLTSTPNTKSLFFRNKIDGTVWKYDYAQ